MKALTYKQKRRLVASICLPRGKDGIFDKVSTLEDLDIIDYETSIFFRERAMEAKSPEELDKLSVDIAYYIINL